MTGLRIDEFAEEAALSKRTVLYSFSNEPSNTTLEKVYGLIYRKGFRLSLAKSELFAENLKKNEVLFFHGSKYGINEIDPFGSKNDSDFSHGFYCSRQLDSASSFVAEYKSSSVYIFKADLSKLNCFVLNCSLDWMLAISYYRRKISAYKNEPHIQNMIRQLEKADVIIAPIADNKMFEVLNQFASGEITSDQALHSLSASRLGDQYVFRTEKAVRKLSFLDRFYLCDEERNNAGLFSRDNENIIQTKLKLAKREFRNQGKYIDELFL
ncbi:MAG: DUF3990 domain-containing protein [Solobacterium sp.]|nr:DUF3990 domain-containing protein [Solobacterium sp.]